MNRFLSALKKVGHVSEDVGKVAIVAAPVAIELAPVAAPIMEVIDAIAALYSKEKNPDMNPLETFAVTMVLGILQQVIKNPTHSAAVENQLVGIATDIFLTYGMVPPSAAITPVAAATH